MNREMKKRMMIMILCLSMIAGLLYVQVPTSAQSEVKTESSQSTSAYSLNGVDYELLYQDDFADDTGYKAALGGTIADCSHVLQDGKLLISGTNQRMTFFNGISGAVQLQNYTVAADFVYPSTSNFHAIVAYGSVNESGTASEGYEFAIVGANFRLYRRNSTPDTLETKAVSNVFTDYQNGDTIRLSIEATTGTSNHVLLTCKAIYNGVEETIFSCTDSTDNKITQGVPGFRGGQDGSTADNIEVWKKSSSASGYLYSDSFSGTEGFAAAQQGNDTVNSYPIQDGTLKIVEDRQHMAMLSGITGASALQNYTVSADFTYPSTSNFHAIVAYGSLNESGTTSYGYEFAVVGSNFRLYRRSASGAEVLAGGDSSAAVTGFFDTYQKGNVVRMSIQADTDANQKVQLICKACYGDVEKTIFTYTDDSANKITQGAPGFRGGQIGSTVDNVLVVSNNIVDEDCLYQDDFSDDVAYTAALGGSIASYNHTLTDGKLVIVGTEQHMTFFSGINGALQLQNYTNAADFVYPTTSNFHAIVAYGSMNASGTASYGYEFAIVGSNFRLYRRSASGAGVLAGGDASEAVTGYFADYKNGDTIRLSITATTDEDGNVLLVCKATYGGVEKEIFNCLDSSDNKIVQGVPGLRGGQEGSTVDNIYISRIPAEESDCLYEDDFTDDVAYTAALGGSIASYNHTLTDGKLVIVGTEQHMTFFSGINGALQLQNYTNAADFVYPTTSNFHAIVAYGSMNASGTASYGYEFAIVGSNFRLYRRSASGAGVLAGGDASEAVTGYFEDYKNGDTIRLSITATTDEDGNVLLVCKATYGGVEKEIFNCLDSSDNKIVQGVPGLRGGQEGSTVDNICVMRVSELDEEEDDDENDPQNPDTPSNPGNPITPESGELPFVEDFSDATKVANRWNQGTSLAIENGQGRMGTVSATKSLYLTGVEGTAQWSDYVLQADITPLTEVVPDGSVNQMAALVVAANSANKGYEFGLLYYPRTGQYEARLYDRINGGVLASAEYYFQNEIPMNMMVVVSDNQLKCFIDGEQILRATIDGTEQLKGTIGLLADGKQALFDNITVTAYDGSYEDEEVEKPVADENGIYYLDDFNKAVRLINNAWPTSVLSISNNKVIVDGDPGTLYLTGDESYSLLQDYTVSAKMTVSADNDITSKQAVGAVVARSSGANSGYEFGIGYSATQNYIRIYDRTAREELIRRTDIELEIGKEYLLTMVCEGNQITCYLDNEQIFSIVDNTNTAGTAGLRTIGTAYFDDFTVAVPAYAQKLGYTVNAGATGGVNSPQTGDTITVPVILLSCMAVSAYYIVLVWKRRVNKEWRS